MRNRLGWYLHRLADRVGPNSAYRCYPAYFRYTEGEGGVLTKTTGVYNFPGCPLYYRDDEYERAWTGEPR